MKDIRFHLNVNEVNLILKSLGNLPYYQVCALIEKMQQQANAQVTQSNGNSSLLNGQKEENIQQQ